MSAVPDTERTIAHAAVHGSWEADAVIDRAGRAILDGTAVALGGMGAPQVRVARATISPLATPARVPTARLWLDDDASYHAGDAAFVAGTAAHSLDWDDYMHPMHGHCSAVLIPALWPLAEAADASGAEFVDAYLAGYHVNWLVSLALSHGHYARGWHATSTIGTVGAAAAASRLLGLPEERTSVALAIAASMASGIRANFGTMTKGMHAGIAARNGVQAALLARADATAGERWLLGPSGMLDCFGGEFPAQRAAEEVAAGRGSGAHGIETGWGLVQKPHTCCGALHGAVDAAIAAVVKGNVDPSRIDRVEVHVDPVVPSIMRVQEPFDEQSARYSPSWVIAAACADRAMGPAQVSDAALARPELRDLRRRVDIMTDLVTTQDRRFAGRVVIFHGGWETSAEVSYPTGHPEAPMSLEQVQTKARAALGLVMGESDAIHVEEALTTLRERRITDVADLIRSARVAG